MSWTLLLDRPRPGWENMAIDAALLDLAAGEGAAFLRLYRWEPHCLSFGRHEPALRRYDVERIRSLELDCVRRPTGGHRRRPPRPRGRGGRRVSPALSLGAALPLLR